MVWPSSWKIIKKVTKGYNLTLIKSLPSLELGRLFLLVMSYLVKGNLLKGTTLLMEVVLEMKLKNS